MLEYTQSELVEFKKLEARAARLMFRLNTLIIDASNNPIIADAIAKSEFDILEDASSILSYMSRGIIVQGVIQEG